MAICDEQAVYSELFVKQISRMQTKQLRICSFSTMEQLALFSLEREIQCLVISEGYEKQLQETQEIQALQYFCFTTEEMKARMKYVHIAGEKRIQYIYRYQSVEDIYEKITENLWTSYEEDGFEEQGTFMSKLVGVYNPVHRNGQTTFAMALAEYYGTMDRKVLYLSLEEYAGITKREESSEGDLGEVLYYLKKDIKSINYRFPAFVVKKGHYDMVPPILMSHELRSITGEEWLAFLSEIMDQRGYEVIVLDLDSCIQGLLEILELCELVYVPILEGNDGEEKRAQFQINLEKLSKSSIHQKMISKHIMRVKDSDREEVLKGVENQVVEMFA